MKMRSPICWPVASFQEVADGVTGTTPSTKKDEYYGGSIPFVGPSDLGFASPITEATKWLSKEGGEVSRLLPPESVLVCCIGATIGKVGFAGTTLSTNQQINALVFDKSQVFPRYGFYYCQTLRKLIRHQGASTTLPLLPKSRFQKIKIPLPPIAEQRRIAAILDKADGIRRDRKQAIQYTEELLRSAFLDMFGEPTNNPKGWDVAELGDLLIDIDSGWSPKCEKHAADTEEWGVLKLGSVSYGYFESHENKAMLPENAPRTELEVRKGDLLFSRALLHQYKEGRLILQ